MKIAQVAPLMESVPPRLYGGTERIVSYLTEELVEQGHDVTLFASGDSLTRRAPGAVHGRRRCGSTRRQGPDPLPSDHARRGAPARREFDVLHFHIDLLHFPLLRDFAWRTVTTLHGRLDLPDLHAALPRLPRRAAGLDLRRPARADAAGELGRHHPSRPAARPATASAARQRRLSRLPRPHLAREAARPRHRDRRARRHAAAGSPPRSTRSTATTGARRSSRWCGAIPMSSSSARSASARRRTSSATPRRCCFPIDWPEPFGLVMIEAMACGTPVIAFRCGSVPEVVDHGVTGFVVDSVEEAVAAVSRDRRPRPRGASARVFERRFTAERMAARLRRGLSPLCSKRGARCRSAGRAPTCRAQRLTE